MNTTKKIPRTLQELVTHYLIDQDMSTSEFCKQVPISRNYLYQIMKDEQKPSPRMENRIRRYIIDQLVEKQKKS